jgi:hypothetical protein
VSILESLSFRGRGATQRRRRLLPAGATGPRAHRSRRAAGVRSRDPHEDGDTGGAGELVEAVEVGQGMLGGLDGVARLRQQLSVSRMRRLMVSGRTRNRAARAVGAGRAGSRAVASIRSRSARSGRRGSRCPAASPDGGTRMPQAPAHSATATAARPVTVLPLAPPGGVTTGVDGATADHVVAVVDVTGTVVDRFTVPATVVGLRELVRAPRRGRRGRDRTRRRTGRRHPARRPDGPADQPQPGHNLRGRDGSAGNEDDRSDCRVTALDRGACLVEPAHADADSAVARSMPSWQSRRRCGRRSPARSPVICSTTTTWRGRAARPAAGHGAPRAGLQPARHRRAARASRVAGRRRTAGRRRRGLSGPQGVSHLCRPTHRRGDSR